MSLKCLYNIQILSNFDPRRAKKLYETRRPYVLDTDTEQRRPEPEFLNFSGAQKSIPRNEFRQPM